MGVEGKRLLVLGAGRGQIGLYKAAKEMGITTIAGTMPDNNPPGIPLADEVCFMNIANPDEVAKKAANLKLDGVATCCLDTGISALGKTCDSLGLTGLPEKAAIMCNDKSKMKKAFMEYGVSTAQYFEISNEEELENALNKIKLPVIIKATDLQGSNGIYIAKTEKDAYDGFHAAMGLTKRSYCIVEEFIEGWEFGAQAFVYNNEVLFVMPHGDETYMSHTAVPVGHYVPLDCDEDVYKQTEIAVKSAIKALGLNNCAVNVDLILRDNKVYVIELTGPCRRQLSSRAGGDKLWNRILQNDRSNGCWRKSVGVLEKEKFQNNGRTGTNDSFNRRKWNPRRYQIYRRNG